jgi:iron complex transport system substrate-binding protein
MSPAPTARRASAALISLLLLGLLAACSGGAASSDSSGAGGAGFPVTVRDKFGSATVPAKPARVVAMDWTDADFALSLGIKPVGIAKVDTVDGGIQPWTKTALGDARPTLFETTDGDPVEQVAALAPDVILATKDYNLSHSYAQLSKIAPVVTYTNAPNTDSWQQDFSLIGQALGQAAKARTITTDTENTITRDKSEHPELSGKTFSYIVAPSASGAYTVNSTTDVSAQLLNSLGLTLSPKVISLPTSSTPGRAQVSLENLGVLDADVVLAAGSSGALATLKANPLFGKLSAVQRGSYVPLAYTTASAIAFPSPASLDWALNQVLPKLSAAAKA